MTYYFCATKSLVRNFMKVFVPLFIRLLLVLITLKGVNVLLLDETDEEV